MEYSAVIENGRRVWKQYRTLYVDGEDFTAIGEAFEKTGAMRNAPLGNGVLRFMKQR